MWGPVGPRVEANFPQVGEPRAPSQTCVPRAQHTEASTEEGGLARLEGGQPGQLEPEAAPCLACVPLGMRKMATELGASCWLGLP